MLQKFQDQDQKQGERSVTRVGNTLLGEDGVKEDLWEHFEAEIQEMRDAEFTEEEMREAVDVANMAFLIWWWDNGPPA